MKINDLRGGVALPALPLAWLIGQVFGVSVANCLQLLIILPGDYSLLWLRSQVACIV